jgi:hypothetical protein
MSNEHPRRNEDPYWMPKTGWSIRHGKGKGEGPPLALFNWKLTPVPIDWIMLRGWTLAMDGYLDAACSEHLLGLLALPP